MRGLKLPKRVTVFRRALNGVKNTGDSPIELKVSIEVDADAFLVYQNYHKAMNDFRKFETQKAEIVEMFRSRCF
jgi:hypothetical protein